MDLNSLKSFARSVRKELIKTVSFKMQNVLSEDSLARRENLYAVNELEKKINISNKDNVIEEVAYTWFNRFTALQYMDLNGFNDVKVIMPIEDENRPEILSNAFIGVFDNKLISEKTKNIVSDLLNGKSSSNNPEKEAYKFLLISVCNKLHFKMPFLFEKIEDYTELLIPDDLLSKTSIIEKIRNVITNENCHDVEIIGWLYQFYISEKKDLVSDYINKKKKVTSENIPAATQLFTPSWIVKYLVQNSLGRLWMINNPESNLIDNMEYYISPKESEKNVLKINSPEEIKVCDPACGSGHMLTYSFDLIYFIYEEEGYDPESIPGLILKNNLYGIEIDRRAAELSGFALTMKALNKEKDFFKNSIKPNICILENIQVDDNEIKRFLSKFNNKFSHNDFEKTLNQFKDAFNFGSLIKPYFENGDNFRQEVLSKDFSKDILLQFSKEVVLRVLDYSDYLGKKYHVLVTNPPYLGTNKVNKLLSDFAKTIYPDSKADLYSMFMERSLSMTRKNGMIAMINMQSWMFIKSYEKLREKVLKSTTILNMAHLGPNGFDSFGGEVVSTTAFVLQNIYNHKYIGDFIRLVAGKSEKEKSSMMKKAILNKDCDFFYRISSDQFNVINGSPINYWMPKSFRNVFVESSKLSDIAEIKAGLQTGNNEKFLRLWSEVAHENINFDFCDTEIAKNSLIKWYPYNKGGEYRNWYGNNLYVVNWEHGGNDIENSSGSVIRNKRFYFKSGVTYKLISSLGFSSRFVPQGFIFDNGSPMLFSDFDPTKITAFLCSKIVKKFIVFLNPTLNFQVGDVQRIPINLELLNTIKLNTKECIHIAKKDWDAYETSWDFSDLSLIRSKSECGSLEKSYKFLRSSWNVITKKMIDLETENNKVLIEAYGLQNIIKPEVQINEITLNCNPEFRYKDIISDKVREEKLQSETIKELISYSVGCIFGRYSLDKNGLILANQGETIEDYLKKVPNPKFMPDNDNVVPILELDWFEDDITTRFNEFLRVTFGTENFENNIRFIENSIGKDIRKYFLNDFYKDHLQTYRQRPIYWMISSPKNSFNALIYIHRYHKDNLSIILDKYLQEFLLKLRAEKKTLERLDFSSNSTTGEKINVMKKIQKVDSIINELQNWEKEVIYPLASQRLELSLDDGVKINYSKFGIALKKI